LRGGFLGATLCGVGEEIVSRSEAVARLFRVSDIAESLIRIEQLLGGDVGEEAEDEG